MHQGIDSIEVRGFKSLAHVVVELRPLNVLIGANASGKSNFVALFRMLNAVTRGSLQTFIAEQGGSAALLHLGLKHTRALELCLRFSTDKGRNVYRAAWSHAAPGRLFFVDEQVGFEPQKVARDPISLGGGHTESRLGETIDGGGPAAKIAQFVKYRLDRYRAYHFHDTSARAGVRQEADIRRDKYLDADAANLAPFLMALRRASPWHYEQIRDAVRLAFPTFDDFVLEPSRANPGLMLLSWRERGSDYDFGAHQASDGSLRFMCLSALLLQPFEHALAPLAITLDEPELGLHPYAVGLLAEMIKRASQQVQVVVATQSSALLSAIGDPDSTLVVHRHGAASDLVRLSAEELRPWLDEYSLGDIWEKGVFQHGGPQG